VILADTSVWIDHFRSADARFRAALEWRQVSVHPFVVGELACGHLKNRDVLLSFLRDLPAAPIASDDEVLMFIERHRLMGLGLGYIDVHLLVSTALAGAGRLWTRDRQLAEIAAKLDLAHVEAR
jgi:predicted nucleic acid-binding protein